MANLTETNTSNDRSRVKLSEGKNDESEIQEIKARFKAIEQKFTYYELIWRSVFIILVIVGFILVERVYQFHNNPIAAHIPKNSIKDFWLSIVVAISVIPIRKWIKNAFYSKIFVLLNQKRSADPQEKHKRCEVHCKWVFDVTYYSLATAFGFSIIKDQAFLPPELLGNGSCNNLFMEFPIVPEIPYLKLYYMVQAGVHLHSLGSQLLSKRGDGKFYEYTLHHSCTVFLIWFSYMMNYLLVGIIVLLIHDPSDVLLILVRAYNDMKKRILILNIGIFVASYSFWVFARNYVLPSCVLKQCFSIYWKFYGEPLFDIFLLPNAFMIGMLFILAVMHAYWTFFFTKSIVTMLSKGEEKNDYDS